MDTTQTAPTLSVTDHSEVLHWASRLTTRRADAAAVVANAQPLLAWLTQASSKDDQRARMAALRHQHSNATGGFGYEPDDNPQQLLDDAQPYYRFLAPATNHA